MFDVLFFPMCVLKQLRDKRVRQMEVKMPLLLIMKVFGECDSKSVVSELGRITWSLVVLNNHRNPSSGTSRVE